MLIVAKSLNELSFGKLMEVYVEGNRENAAENYPDESENQGLRIAEQDFYNYLREVFFCTPGAVYAIWEVDGKYLSALRLEPYKDGLLLEALETVPQERRKGYAATLIREVQVWLGQQGSCNVYSHVHKRNIASLKIHEKCGFQRILEHAVCIDGSVNHYCCTLCYDN